MRDFDFKTAAPSAAGPATTVLAVNNLTISLPVGADRPHAIRHVSLDVRQGEIVCLLGESGSGKSVIAQAVMGLLPAALKAVDGSIELLGEDVLTASPDRIRQLRGEKMAMVFQEPMTALNPIMTCGAQVDEMLAQHSRAGVGERRRRILEIFAHVRLPEPERIYASYPHQLSGGQRQRIVIAMALILKPSLLICDEPTTALDVTTQAEILKLIRELQTESGTAVLFITHDFGVVAEIADRVVVLRLGDMVEQGARLQVLQQPREPYTRMLLAAVPTLVPRTRAPVEKAYPLLDARGIGKTYVTGSWPNRKREVRAARDVSLTVHPGETVGIVGESGSGKSTVARCIARLIEPSAGDIFAGGRSVAKARGRALYPFRRGVQVVFQDPYRSLDPRQTVGASIVEGPLNFGVPYAQAWQRAEELMTLVRLRPDALNRYPSEFSGGQRQRISIARALACEPQVLIADEAVSALDVSVQAQILELLDDIQQRLRIGILFITHDLRVASQICDRVIVMRRGEIVEEGAIQDVFLAPRHEYTRALLAAAPGRGFAFGAA
ncbi:dipeptide ABC transporter ATP-binding protein [Paraburkholderia aspalathi]|uniref:dipeptide ABC transporter ATP-binding protein n=1 Tax=Paraburkholderia aspalathi TaxID=1324617 RepID=UPI0038BD1851